jgi:hypothetical protein
MRKACSSKLRPRSANKVRLGFHLRFENPPSMKLLTLHMNYLDYSAIRERIADADAAYWAIGISSLGVARGWSYDRAGLFQPDSVASPALTRSELEALVMDPADRVTFMCAPWGSGERIGIDGDLDGILNADEA